MSPGAPAHLPNIVPCTSFSYLHSMNQLSGIIYACLLSCCLFSSPLFICVMQTPCLTILVTAVYISGTKTITGTYKSINTYLWNEWREFFSPRGSKIHKGEPIWEGWHHSIITRIQLCWSVLQPVKSTISAALNPHCIFLEKPGGIY